MGLRLARGRSAPMMWALATGLIAGSVVVSWPWAVSVCAGIVLAISLTAGVFGSLVPLVLLRDVADLWTGVYVIPDLVNIPGVLGIGTVVLGAGTLVYRRMEGRLRLPSISRPVGLWVVIMAPYALLTFVRQPEASVASIAELVRLAGFWFILYLASTLTARQAFMLLDLQVWAGSFVSLYSLYELLASTAPVYEGIARVQGTVYFPNSFALFLIYSIALTLWRSRVRKSRFGIYEASAVVQVIALFNTASLAGVLMLAVAVVVLSGHWPGIPHRKKWLVASIGVAIVVFAVVTIGKLNSRTALVLSERDLYAVATSGQSVSSFGWRLNAWYELLGRFRENPIIGFGLGTAEYVNPLSVEYRRLVAPHNEYLRMMVETGAVGLTAFVWVCYRVMESLRALTRSNDRNISSLGAVLLGVWSALLVGMAFNNYLGTTVFHVNFWSGVGCLQSWVAQSVPSQSSSCESSRSWLALQLLK